jgi:hypothetical protein
MSVTFLSENPVVMDPDPNLCLNFHSSKLPVSTKPEC